MNQDYVKIDDRFKAKFIYITIIGFILLFLPLIIFVIVQVFTTVSNFGMLIFLQIFLAILFLPILFMHFRNNYPPYEVAFLAYENSFEFRIYNQVYKKYMWDNIEKLEFIKERIDMLSSGKNDLKMKIFIGDDIEELRIYLLKFRKKNFEAIKNVIKNSANSHNIEVIETTEYEVFDLEDRTRELHELQSFTKAKKSTK